LQRTAGVNMPLAVPVILPEVEHDAACSFSSPHLYAYLVRSPDDSLRVPAPGLA
jgi:hypothetical protein